MTMNAAWALATIGALLASATGIVGALRWARIANRELWLRVRSWWLIVAPFAIAVLLGPTTSLVFTGLVSFVAFREYASIVRLRPCDREVVLIGYVAIPIQYVAIAMGWHGFALAFVPVLAVLGVPAWTALRGERRGFLRSTGVLGLGLLGTIYAIGHLGFVLASPTAAPAGGLGLFVFVLALTEANDVAQFLWGKLFGGARIAPRLSPNKTWAGFLGGIVATAVLALSVAPLQTPLDRGVSLAAGALLAASGFLGDLVMSALKRDLGLKDTGTLLPGHGGVLDRIDSLVFTAPCFFYFARCIGA
jgi:phosphatidate cytidylyltransferase